jgi:hypothetical protein
VLMKLQVDEVTWHLTFLLAYPILENKQIYRENFAKRRNSRDARDYRFAITFTVLSKVAESTSLLPCCYVQKMFGNDYEWPFTGLRDVDEQNLSFDLQDFGERVVQLFLARIDSDLILRRNLKKSYQVCHQ